MSETPTELEKIFAKMWIECDPNRMVGIDPDQSIEDLKDVDGSPRWHWFLPRAQASLKYLQEAGVNVYRETN